MTNTVTVTKNGKELKVNADHVKYYINSGWTVKKDAPAESGYNFKRT